ncbi:hypothetical protein GGH12_005005 [Coemansia sp. RSA 1822]|nr:hypothetical protein LPJ76_003699 [Coemansia sp. RSA 638]KAJ2539988.1 hypothetical protein GGF49_004803 [Coemansia sp. RSA 1853]KAJ2560212.1 hypothetical protein GGH12_005005 [Coemansia sp. RSA 1822]
MVSIADFDNRIVGRIVNVACYGATGSSAQLHTQAQLVALASVSRTWHELVRPHLQSILIIECQPTPEAPQPASNNRGGKRRTAWKSPVINGNLSSKKGPGTCIWRTNAELVHLLQQHTNGVSVPVSRLRLQSFDTAPDFTGFVAAMDNVRLARCRLDTVTSLVVMEFIGVSTAVSAAVSTLDSNTGNGASQAAECIAQHAPNVRSMVCAPWNVSPAFRQLASPLAVAYLRQLHTLTIPLATPLLTDSQIASSLTTLHIHAHILAASGPGIVPAQQLQVLRVHDAPAFFPWEAFASAGEPDMLEFASLTALGIDFASDDVVTTADFYSSINRAKSSVHVTMGRDRRRLVFPKLHSLSVSKVPFTYAEAWRMFIGAPVRRLAVAGPYAHVRYVDTRLLRTLDTFDVHTVGAEKSSHGRFTSFVKTLLGEDSNVTCAWLRHCEAFPLSVPETVRWSQLTELCLAAYVPALALLLLVGQLPSLHRLVVQRIAGDACEEVLDSKMHAPWGDIAAPAAPVSTSVRELQMHMGGGPTARIPTLQAMCYVLLCLPGVRRLAVKQVYCDYVRDFIRSSAESHPALANIELVRHVFIAAKSPMFVLD